MNIIYMGTPDFAVPALETLAASGHRVTHVVSQPDAPRDRGGAMKPTPVKARAIQLGLPVLQPETLRGNNDFLETLKSADPDLIVVAAYGRILPAAILSLPSKGCINIHASLLPRHRGAAPIQRAILEGDERTGISLMKMDTGLDTGDVLAIAETDTDRKTAGELHEELAQMGARLLGDCLPAIDRNELIGIPQDDSKATYAPMIAKKDGKLDLSGDALSLERQIRAMDPWPGAYAYYGDTILKVCWAEVEEGIPGHEPGTILEAGPRGILVTTGKGILRITKIQAPGKKKMDASAFIRGNKIEIRGILR